MRPALRSAVLLTVVLAIASCGTGRRQNGPLPPERARTTVRVENRNFLDMTVYVLNGAQRVRLGSVPGVSTRVLTIPDNLLFGVSSLRFVADPVGGERTPPSWEIPVQPGDEVLLIIPNG